MFTRFSNYIWVALLLLGVGSGFVSCTNSDFSEPDRENLTDYERDWVSGLGTVDKRHTWNAAVGVTLAFYVEEDATVSVFSIDTDATTANTSNDKSRLLHRFYATKGSYKVLVDVPQHITMLQVEKVGATGGELKLMPVKSFVTAEFKNTDSSADYKALSRPLQSWYLAFEDCSLPLDYDFNDVVIKITPSEDYSVANVTLCAAGSTDEIFMYFLPKAKQDPIFMGGAHDLFGDMKLVPINTSITFCDYVDLGDYELPDGFSMSANASMFYIEPYTTHARYSVPTSSGCVPKAFCVPAESWYWTTEFMFVGDAYPDFKKWNKNCLTYGDWYTTYYPQLVVKR